MLSRKKVLSLWNDSLERATSRQIWSAGLLVVSSAALGGIAVALWNRKIILKMRVAEEEAASEAPGIAGSDMSEIDEISS